MINPTLCLRFVLRTKETREALKCSQKPASYKPESCFSVCSTRRTHLTYNSYPRNTHRSAAFGNLAEEDEWEEVVHGGHSWEAPGGALTELMEVVVVRIHD